MKPYIVIIILVIFFFICGCETQERQKDEAALKKEINRLCWIELQEFERKATDLRLRSLARERNRELTKERNWYMEKLREEHGPSAFWPYRCYFDIFPDIESIVFKECLKHN